jgi:hypothetical protein
VISNSLGSGARRAARLALAAGALFAASPLLGQAQDFGDTPYVQTPMNVVKAMLDMAKVGPKDYVIDLGSGDGRMVITAAKDYGARGFGVDHDARLVHLANANAVKAGVSERVSFYARDLYKTDVQRATVMSIYLLPEVNLMARPKLLRELKPGTRIVSHDYDMGEWQPDQQRELEAPGKPVGRDPVSKIFFWVVPANVTGDWSVTLRAGARAPRYALQMTQKFQVAGGALNAGAQRVPLQDVKLTGARLAFKAMLPNEAGKPVAHHFSARVAGESMEGTLQVEGSSRAIAWRAQRTGGKTAIGPEPDPKLAELKAGSGVQ